MTDRKRLFVILQSPRPDLVAQLCELVETRRDKCVVRMLAPPFERLELERGALKDPADLDLEQDLMFMHGGYAVASC